MLDWRKRISDHIAYALLVYTGLQIFVTIAALREGSASVLPGLALVVLVAGIIPCLSPDGAAMDAVERCRSR
jgi:hypothetical protein